MSLRCRLGIHKYEHGVCTRCHNFQRALYFLAASDSPPHITSVDVDLEVLAEVLKRIEDTQKDN